MDAISVHLSKSPLFHYVKEHLVQVFLVAAVTYLIYQYVKDLLFKKLPPGPIGLPLVGYRPLLGSFPQKKLADLGKIYGGIMSVRLGPKLTVVVNDYDLLKETFNHPMALARHKEVFDHMSDSGFATANGAEWEEQRRFCMQSSRDLGLGRGQWESTIQEEVGVFIENLKSHKGKPYDVGEELNTSVNNNVLALLIGRRLQPGVEDDKLQIAKNYNYYSVNFMAAHSVVAMMPKVRRMLERFNIAGFERLAKATSDFGKLVRQEVKKHRFSEDYSGVTDFINLYLKKLEAVSSQQKHYFSDKNLEGNLKILFLGGADTIFTSLCWLFRLMAAHQDVQKKVHEELDEVLGRDGAATYEERFKIPYTFAVLMEAQRFVTTAPLPIRMALEEFVVRGYTIPKGVQILANLYAIHQDTKYWEDPEKFIPERFLSEDKKKFIANKPGFVPFSVGRRNCPGETVAWMEILSYFTAVMQKFQITLPPGVKVDFEVTPGLIAKLVPQPLCFVERT